MANYASLLATIANNITDNNSGAITGPVLKSVLDSMVGSLGTGYQFMGVATTSTNPGTPDQKVYYLAGPGTYTNFNNLVVADGEIAILKYDSAWSKVTTPIASAAEVSQLGQKVDELDIEINGTYITQDDVESSGKGFVSNSDGKVPVSNENSDYYEIPAYGIETISASVYANSSNYVAIAFYSTDTPTTESYMSGIRAAGTQSLETFSDIPVPEGCRLIIVSNRTILGSPSFTAVGIGIADKVASLKQEVASNTTHEEIIETFTLIDAGSAYWAEKVHAFGTYRLTGNVGDVTIGLATAYSSSSVIRTMTIAANSDNIYNFEVTRADISNGVKYIRLATSKKDASSTLVRYVYYTAISLAEKLNKPFAGLTFAVVGDSISTINGGNTPYWTIKSIDVGHSISAFVSWFDVWDDESGTTPTNKTIGGVTLTSDMIGTLQTFTPTNDDVGKVIGKPFNYNPSSVVVWSQTFAEKTGMIMIANASYSGARIASGQTGLWANTEAWSDYTIGCCKVRDDDGNFVTPDVIFVYRGTNDFSHQPISRINDVSLSAGIPDTDYVDGVPEFKAGYYKTIQKLRTAYPKAYIVCCTLNVFKRMTHDKFPTRNAYYTLPEMNDAIREIANTMGCGLIEFDKDGITFENCYSGGYITDSASTPTHPNTLGHNLMAEKAVADFRFAGKELSQ